MTARLLIRDVLVADPESTIAPERKDIVVADGRIAAMAAGRTTKAAAQQIIDGRERLLLPGLVNAHTHSPLNILKGTGDVLSHPAFMWRNQADTADRTPEEIRLCATVRLHRAFVERHDGRHRSFPRTRFRYRLCRSGR